MSFLLTLNASVREERLVVEACCRLGWDIPVPVEETYRGRQIRGLKVVPPGSSYPIYVDVETGDLVYDSDVGAHAEALMQGYNTALVYDEATRRGYSVTESRVGEDIVLSIMVP